jgi:hypothetical protein
VKTTRLRISLREVTPPVLRVLDVPSVSTLPELHDLLQVGLGWTDSHLHMFVADQVRFGVPDEDDEHLLDESGATLRDLPARFSYRYDFGDNWRHDVEVLGSGRPEPGCVYGEGACPPEDCGGTSGYAELLEALADPEHPEHETMRVWSSGWSDFDQEVTDALVRDTVGTVPASVRLLLDLLSGGVRLTPGGRLPRVLVRQVQEQRPGWCPWDKPASIEEDLFALSALHDLLRRVGLVRLTHGVLAPTKAAADDLQIIRRLRRAFEPNSFDDILVGVAVAELVTRSTRSSEDLAVAVHPYLDRWGVNGRPVTPDDVQRELNRLGSTMQALDLVERDWPTWQPGSSARTLLPRATALAHIWRHRETAG